MKSLAASRSKQSATLPGMLTEVTGITRAGETVRAHRSLPAGRKGDPLRKLLDAVRENYVGDLNRKTTTLNITPVPSFVVTQLCAAQNMPIFVANLPMPMLTGIVRIVKADVVLQKGFSITHGGCPFSISGH